MLREAKTNYPTLSARLTCDTLPNLSSIDDTSYDGILCWAVFMHLPEEVLFDTVFNRRRILKPGGRLLISTPLVGPATDPATHHDPNGRLFNGVTPENFHFLLERVGFHRTNGWRLQLLKPKRRMRANQQMERKRQSAAVKQNGNKVQTIPTQPTLEHVVAAMERTVQRVHQMSRRELVQSLKDAGILTPAGKLAASYR
jgi:hypothetical protein